jgi:hypothetical protein
MNGPDGHAALAQSDVLIFQQYARAIAEGHPYRYFADDPPSTGSTSHLYPAVLGAAYWLGAKGDSLATAGLLLNAFFYLASMQLVVLIAWRLDRRAAPMAGLLCALSPQCLAAFFFQTDMGLFVTLAFGAVAAALDRRVALLALFLALASWCRPEGLILSALLLAAAIAPSNWVAWPGGRRRGWIVAGAIGVACYGGVLSLNHWLTGYWQFESVMHKGMIAWLGLGGAAKAAVNALGRDLREGLFNLADEPRSLYLLPVAGGMLGLVGVLSRRWRRAGTARVEMWWIASAVAAAVLVAQSGWDSIQMDKYWAWFMPAWLIYVAIGLRRVGERLPWPHAGRFLAVALVAYQALAGIQFLASYGQYCASMTQQVRFLHRIDADLPKSKMACSRGAIAYLLPGHRVDNISGIASPRFLAIYDWLNNVERLRHCPELRFDAWIVPALDAKDGDLAPMLGRQLMAQAPLFSSTSAFVLHEAKWDKLDRTTAPLTLTAPGRLVDALDVGYDEDEARCDYDLFARAPGARSQRFVTTGVLGGRPIAEIGRLVVGSETFTIQAQPHKALWIVLRGALDATVPIVDQALEECKQRFEFVSPMTLNVLVDDRPAGQWIVKVDAKPDPAKPDAKDESAKPDAKTSVLFESVFEIPAEAMTTDRPRLTIGGDHISLGYWFYQ